MREYTISSDDSYFRLELKYLWRVFHEKNGYPHWFITKVMNEVNRLNILKENSQEINENENGGTSWQTLILPYACEKGCSIVRSLEQQLKRSQPNTVFICTNLSSNFNVKDPVPFTKKDDIIYRSVCAAFYRIDQCNPHYSFQFEQLKDAMRTTLVNALELYMSVYKTITVVIICLI